mmetsp:Transcript_29841/g.100500  ORF Transcript_29841/g.100500 Transcript_29841/m.100500 type:complete len:85 (+) Transcript_29841:74-328(+)
MGQVYSGQCEPGNWWTSLDSEDSTVAATETAKKTTPMPVIPNHEPGVYNKATTELRKSLSYVWHCNYHTDEDFATAACDEAAAA